jgi:hypothetical protein
MRFKLFNIFRPAFAEGDLINLEDMGGTKLQKYDDSEFDKATSTKYLQRLQLMTSSTKMCKSGEFPINHYALVRDQNFDDLGKEVDALVIAWRPKALEMGDQVIAIFDSAHSEFERIKAKSEEKDSGCMWGPEYLLYIPQREAFCTFFMGTKSARREAPALKALLNRAATLKAHEIETAAYTWWAPQVHPCTTAFDLPATAEIIEVVEKFNNPATTEVERVEDDGETERAQ